jgi:hypothetical protein
MKKRKYLGQGSPRAWIYTTSHAVHVAFRSAELAGRFVVPASSRSSATGWEGERYVISYSTRER